MNPNVTKFEKNWSILNTPGEGSEAHVDLLIDLARQDPEVRSLVEAKFRAESRESLKEYLAMIAVNSGLVEPYLSYLKTNHGWEDTDFS
ncbi:MAG: hypothetical protein NTX25_01390 [Proteobacteria bacterium]|nr:hypothetical protein [Pseudomonadota bacterium]